MNTILVDKKQCKMVAHRGVSGLERENTCPAFVAAGVKTYYGIETDVHVTADGKFIICHDDNIKRVCGVDMVIEESKLEDLRKIPVWDTDDKTHRSDLWLPLPEDYFAICKKYDKIAVLELKNDMPATCIDELVALIKGMDMFENTMFISFSKANVMHLRESEPTANIQFLTGDVDDSVYDFLQKYQVDIDMYYECLTQEKMNKLHSMGVKVNVYTVNEPADADKLIAMGIDFITSNILE